MNACSTGLLVSKANIDIDEQKALELLKHMFPLITSVFMYTIFTFSCCAQIYLNNEMWIYMYIQ